MSARWLGSFWPICSPQVSQRTSEIETSGSKNASYTFGFGTGLLAASTVSCCSTPEQLLPAALETVLISFRVGLLAADTRDQIIADKKTLASWRVKIEADEPAIVLRQLEEFSTQKVESLQTLRKYQLTLKLASADMVKAIWLLCVSRFTAAQRTAFVAQRVCRRLQLERI